MKFTVFTLFPEWFGGPLGDSIIGRARQSGALSLHIINFREFAKDRHGTVDDAPYGGGGGMVLRADVLAAAMDATIGAPGTAGRPHVVLTSARGKIFEQQKAMELARHRAIAFVCGHYEGVDERLIETRIDEEISLGPFVLTGGELAAMTMIDAIARMIPGVLGNSASAPNDSYMNGLLEGAHYTRPETFEGRGIPEVLRSGNHAAIEKWRQDEALARTRAWRPDLWEAQLLHPDQVRRIARRARPIAVWRGARDFSPAASELLYISSGARQAADWEASLRGSHCERGLTDNVWLKELREAPQPTAGQFRAEIANAITEPRYSQAHTLLRNILRELGQLDHTQVSKEKNPGKPPAPPTGESA
ncbi:tRNA (guanosine(37)-N1)-methyltransferase TrmD [Candidatus Sumerlaeota bacterium]|nr:tRNA (guanosine(37)-N1)-methyltransferase TrmD [Candidatus Sumerlaeota bacterium]